MEKEKQPKGLKDKAQDKMTFESALESLEDIAEKLESGEMGLDESIRLFEKGMTYAKYCHDKLGEAERKIEILQKGETGTVKSRPVKVKNDTGEIEDDEDLQGSLL